MSRKPQFVYYYFTLGTYNPEGVQELNEIIIIIIIIIILMPLCLYVHSVEGLCVSRFLCESFSRLQ